MILNGIYNIENATNSLRIYIQMHCTDLLGLTTTTAFGATDLLEGVVVLLLQDFRVKTLL